MQASKRGARFAREARGNICSPTVEAGESSSQRCCCTGRGEKSPIHFPGNTFTPFSVKIKTIEFASESADVRENTPSALTAGSSTHAVTQADMRFFLPTDVFVSTNIAIYTEMVKCASVMLLLPRMRGHPTLPLGTVSYGWINFTGMQLL